MKHLICVIVFRFVLLVTTFAYIITSCLKVNNDENNDTIFQNSIVSNRDSPTSALHPFYVDAGNGDTIDVSNFGNYHNLVLQYAISNAPLDSFVLNCTYLNNMIGIINNGIVCQDSGIYNYIPVIDWECNDIIDHINNIIGAESSNNDIVIVCQQYLDSLESYEAISSNERNLINAFIEALLHESQPPRPMQGRRMNVLLHVLSYISQSKNLFSVVI